MKPKERLAGNAGFYRERPLVLEISWFDDADAIAAKQPGCVLQFYSPVSSKELIVTFGRVSQPTSGFYVSC